MRGRAILLSVFLLSVVFLPGEARADVVLGPQVFAIPAAMLFFLVFAVAIIARLFLSALRVRKGSGRGYGTEAALAAVVSVAFFILSWAGSEVSRSRRIARERPKSNLGAIRSTQVAYFAEWGFWVGNQPCTPVLDRSLDNRKTVWDNATRFSILGFVPEGKVQCSYCLEGPDRPTAVEGFTARAECDLDGDGSIAIYTINNSSTDILKSGAPF